MKRPVPTLATYEDVEGSLGVLTTVRGNLPLTTLSLKGRITGLLYRLTLRHTFHNPYAEALEATCIFPLPGRAGVFKFRLRVGERALEGRLEERGAARRQYRSAVEAGHGAATLEQERAEVFTLQAGCIPPGGTVLLELEMGGALDYAQGEATFRFPLVVAPPHIPGDPLPGTPVGTGTWPDTDAVPDASRVSPPVLLRGQSHPVRLDLELELDPAGLPFRELRSSLHALEWCRSPEGFFLLTLMPGVDRLDRDLILRVGLKADAVVSSFLLLPDAGSQASGTFAVTLIPPGLARPPHPLRAVFLLDRSTSMAGWKLALARRAVERLTAGLSEHDSFAVVLFGGPPEELLPMEPATQARKRELSKKLERVTTGGAAELGPALARALESYGATSLLLLSGGQIGNETQILEYVARAASGVRLHAIAVDRAANLEFLRSLSERTGGTVELVEAEERLTELLPRLHDTLGTPLLSRLRLDDFPIHEVAPDPLPDLFRGQPLMVFGRYEGPAPEGITVLGTAGNREHARRIPAAQSSDPMLRITWARRRLLDLEYRFDVGLETAERVRDFSLRWGVLSRFTALVAVDPAEPVSSGALHQVVQAVELPSGWESLAEEPQPLLEEPPSVELELEYDAPYPMFAPMVAAEMPFVAPLQLQSVDERPPSPPADSFFGAPVSTAETDSLGGRPGGPPASFGVEPVSSAPAVPSAGEEAIVGPPSWSVGEDSFVGPPSVSAGEEAIVGPPSLSGEDSIVGPASMYVEDDSIVGAPSLLAHEDFFGAASIGRTPTPPAVPAPESSFFDAPARQPAMRQPALEPVQPPVARPEPETPPPRLRAPSAPGPAVTPPEPAPAPPSLPTSGPEREALPERDWSDAGIVDRTASEVPEPGWLGAAPMMAPSEEEGWLGERPRPFAAEDDWLKVSPVMESVPPLTAAADWGDDWFSAGIKKETAAPPQESGPAAPTAGTVAPPAGTAAPEPSPAPAPPQPPAAPEPPTIRPKPAAPAEPPPPPAAGLQRAGMAGRFSPPEEGGKPVLMRRALSAAQAAPRPQDRKQRLLQAFQGLDNEVLRKVLEGMELEEVVLALHWVNENLIERICKLLGESRARMFRHRLAQGRKMTPAAVEAAQGKFLRLVNQFA
ncbi:MAG: VWA domain-containing protein [Armatimonadetes bacterium]|nr:VWA domain-containing protein [Armatimonadota bacterium]